MHEGISPPKSCISSTEKAVYVGFLRRNIHVVIISPKSITCVSSPLCTCSSIPGVSLVVIDPKVTAGHLMNWCYVPIQSAVGIPKLVHLLGVPSW